MDTKCDVAKRLSFVLPDFVRVSWVSDRARDTWAPRLRRIIEAWTEVERRAVVFNVRSCALVRAQRERYIAATDEWHEHGLTTAVLEEEENESQSLECPDLRTSGENARSVRLVIGAPLAVCEFRQAWASGQHDQIGALLGYPPCCRQMFAYRCVEQNSIDPVWATATANATLSDCATIIDAHESPLANLLWRYIGVRALPHLCCRFDCEGSLLFAQELLSVARQSGYDTEVNWMLQVLSWPAEWSALHGIAEIKTPILKLATRTDATSNKLVVRWQGDQYPSEGAQGVVFPYKTMHCAPITGSRSFQRGLTEISSSISRTLPVLDE